MNQTAAAPAVDAGRIMQTATAFWSSKVLLTAVGFDLFSRLGKRSMTGEELGAALDCIRAAVTTSSMRSSRSDSSSARVKVARAATATQRKRPRSWINRARATSASRR